MSTKYVRIVPSSEVAGTSLSGEITQAFERIRERAQAIYETRAPDAPGCEFDDWLQAERELFEVPQAAVDIDDSGCRLTLEAEASRERPITIVVEPGQVTALGHRVSDGLLCLYRVVNLSELIDVNAVKVQVRAGEGVQLVLTSAVERRTMAAAAGSVAGEQRTFAA